MSTLQTSNPRLRRQMITTLIVVGGLASTSLAQDNAEATSFAEAFFISYSTDASGAKSIEWLGSLVIWTLMATSVASIGLIGQLVFAFKPERIAPQAVVKRAAEYLANGRFREALSMLSEPGSESDFSSMLKAALERAPGGHVAMEAGLEVAATEVLANRVRRVEILNVIGQVSPMLGLFGTVYGMILAFQSIVSTGGNADPVLLAGGIGTALVTTFWGLIVAIPALSGYAVLRGRLDATLAEAVSEAETLVERFRPKPASREKTGGDKRKSEVARSGSRRSSKPEEERKRPAAETEEDEEGDS